LADALDGFNRKFVQLPKITHIREDAELEIVKTNRLQMEAHRDFFDHCFQDFFSFYFIAQIFPTNLNVNKLFTNF